MDSANLFFSFEIWIQFTHYGSSWLERFALE